MAITRRTDMTEQRPAVQPETLRASMVEELWKLDAIRSDRVAEAFGTVPRELFAPGEPLERVYAAETPLITKKDEHGVAVSSVSAARIQAFMLEQAGPAPGMRALEIGSGGYNAALMAELVGQEGHVTTVDIDPDVTERARRCLDAAGYERVRVVLADAAQGVPSDVPFDRIIVTVGAADIPPAWTEQLAPGGRLVVPLRVRGQTRSIAFERRNDHLVSLDYQLCGFVPIRGAGENRERLILLHGEDVGLRLDGGQQVDDEALRDALTRPHSEEWSGVMVGGDEPFDDLDLWLATVLPGYGLLTATPAARERGLVASASPAGISTLIDGGTFAYRTVRPADPERTTFEFGAYAHGPHADRAAQQLVAQIRTWDREHRNGDRPHFQVHPAGTPDDRLPAGLVVDRPHSRITLTWPSKS